MGWVGRRHGWRKVTEWANLGELTRRQPHRKWVRDWGGTGQGTGSRKTLISPPTAPLRWNTTAGRLIPASWPRPSAAPFRVTQREHASPGLLLRVPARPTAEHA